MCGIPLERYKIGDSNLFVTPWGINIALSVGAQSIILSIVIKNLQESISSVTRTIKNLQKQVRTHRMQLSPTNSTDTFRYRYLAGAISPEQIAYNNGFERRIERLENNLKSAQEHSNNLKAKINQLTSTIEIQRHWIDELQQKHNTFIENEETIISRLTSNEDGLRK
ncbi:9971_t:CDS:2 [Rhizophagus irregularis]|nr:9971_t:CDS:2 [Rhizophagus irregularis]